MGHDWRTRRGARGPAVLATTLALVLAVVALVGLTQSERPRSDASSRPIDGGLEPLVQTPAVPPRPPVTIAPRAPDPSAIAARAAALPQLRSLLVSWQGRLVVEHYADNVRATTPANIKSASKSVLSALVGLALARGALPPLDTPIARWFPALERADDARKRTITLEHLLTMQTGLASTSGRNYGAWVRSRDWVAYALARPMVSDPGTTMEYSTGTSHVLSSILTTATGVSTWQFARDALTRPLGFTLARWPRGPRGIYFGGNDMLLTPRQMTAIGELYLHDGVVPAAGTVDVITDAPGAGTRLLPDGWVDASCTPRTQSQFDPGREYGYAWWIRDIGGATACFAWGYGGQYILVFRDLSLVVVATSSPDVSDERHGHRRRLLDLIGEEVVSPVAGRHDTPVDRTTVG